jgi:hypothetical protein
MLRAIKIVQGGASGVLACVADLLPTTTYIVEDGLEAFYGVFYATSYLISGLK